MSYASVGHPEILDYGDYRSKLQEMKQTRGIVCGPGGCFPAFELPICDCGAASIEECSCFVEGACDDED